MGWKMKTLIALGLAMALAGGAWMGFSIRARYQGNDYVMQMTTAFNAAALVNGEETYTDEARAVISAYGGRRYVIIPENYKAVVSLLRKDYVMPPFRRVSKDAPLEITVCGGARLQAEPDPDGVDGALIRFTADNGRRFDMHVRGGNIWKQIVEYATVGHGDRLNLALGEE